MNDEPSIFDNDDLPPLKVSIWYKLVAVIRTALCLAFAYRFFLSSVVVFHSYELDRTMMFIGKIIGLLIMAYILAHYYFYSFFQIKAEWQYNNTIFHKRKSRWFSTVLCGIAIMLNYIYFIRIESFDIYLSMMNGGFFLLSFIIFCFDIYYLYHSKGDSSALPALKP